MFSGLTELIKYFIYIILFANCIFFLVFSLVSEKNKFSNFKFGFSLICGFLLIFLKTCVNYNYNRSQLTQVGIYYLTDYPSCKSCRIELKENLKYIVFNNNKEVEKGDWHYEVGGDYWITYLNGRKSILGEGIYSYQKYNLKYSE
jgi:hypothetical protein